MWRPFHFIAGVRMLRFYTRDAMPGSTSQWQQESYSRTIGCQTRLGGQLLLGQAGCLSCCLEALFACLGFVPFINDYLGEFNFGGLVKRMVRADNPIEWRHFKKVAKT